MISFFSKFFSRTTRESEENVKAALSQDKSGATAAPISPKAPQSSDPSQTISAVSHELRTPLNGILGVVELLERTELDHRQRQLVSTLNASAQLMLRSLDGLRPQQRANTINPSASAKAAQIEREPQCGATSRTPSKPGLTDARPTDLAKGIHGHQPEVSAAAANQDVQRQSRIARATGKPVVQPEQVATPLTNNLESFDLCNCVEDAAAACALELASARRGVSVYVGSNVPAQVMADKELVSSTLTAVMKHAAQIGSIYINVRREAVSEASNRVRFSVRKTTPGQEEITPAPEASKSINTRTEFWKEAQALAARWGAEVSVRQLSDGDWSFELAADFEAAPDDQKAAPAPKLSGERTLVVINSETERQIIANYLGSIGADVITAATMWEAEELLGDARKLSTPFAVVLFEEDASWAKNREFLENICNVSVEALRPSIAVLAHRWESSREQLSEAAANANIVVVDRPVRRQALFDAAARLAQSTGSAAEVSIPAISTAPAQIASTTTEPSALPDGVSEIAKIGAHLLVADDILINQEVMREHLSELGCTATVVDNGLQAVEAFKTGKFDAVLMDCQMPEMDGLTATHEIRLIEKQDGLQRTPIIGVSAHVFEAERALFLGGRKMDDFLCKPYSLDELEESILRALQAQLEAEVA